MGEKCEDNKCCKDGYCEMTSAMMCTADKAWESLMIEKMKAVWEKERGSNMTAAADVVVKHSMAVWANRMAKQDMKAELSKEEVDKFKEDLNKAMME